MKPHLDFKGTNATSLKKNIQQSTEYWKQALENSPPCHSLHLDHPRPAQSVYQKEVFNSLIPVPLFERFKALCDSQGISYEVGIKAIFALLISRYSRESDILIGILTRQNEGPEPGLDNNHFALRMTIEDALSFKDVLQLVTTKINEANQHRSISFEQMVDELSIPTDLNHHPIYQFKLNFDSDQSHPDLFLECDITLHVDNGGESVRFKWEYNANLFKRETVNRLSIHFTNLIESVCNHPEQKVQEIPILSEQETHQLLNDWNESRSFNESFCSVHELFESQAQKTPDAIALVYENSSLTYAELNYKANLLATYLNNKGITANEIVGLSLDRSLELIVSLLGVLKAGAAYVPLDPDYPPARLEFMLKDSGATYVIFQTGNANRSLFENVQGLCLDSIDFLDELDTNVIDHKIQKGEQINDLAYMIYTSGTTGNPKGVLIEHGPAVRHILGINEKFKIEASDRSLHFASINFDAAFEQLMVPLSVGATVYIISNKIRDPHSFRQFLNHHNITTVDLPPSFAAHVFDTTSCMGESDLKLIILGGEAVSQPLMTNCLNLFPKARVINAYGPTEAVVTATTFEASSNNPIPSNVPIGKKCDGRKLYVVDRFLNPVPIGVPGELLIGGDCLARGYLNHPQLTAEKFINNPFSDTPQEHLYKSGDLVRYLDNGDLEFLGRIDDQVNVRGFRIEVGEIEAVLNGQKEVKESVVVAINNQLIAYLVTNASVKEEQDAYKHRSNQRKALKTCLQQSLPAYMQPSRIIFLEQFPLLPNGKINKRVLLDIRNFPMDRSSIYIPPVTEVEKRLAPIIEEILKIDRFGLEDCFFELGGDSLLVAQAVSMIHKAFKKSVPIDQFFKTSTLQGIAKIIEEQPNDTDLILVPELKKAPKSDKTVLSFAQQRLWFLHQYEEKDTTYTIHINLKLTGNLNHKALEESFTELIRRHEQLRTSFVEENGAPVQIVHPQLRFELNTIECDEADSQAHQDHLDKIIQAHENHGFRLDEAGQIKAVLIQLEPSQHILLISVHHIIFDGWSCDLLLQELSLIYNAKLNDQVPGLKMTDIDYRDYAIWQHNHAQHFYFESQLAYWKENLADAPPLLELPYDKPRPKHQTHNGELVSGAINEEVTRSLSQVGREYSSATLFMVLLAGFKILLSRISGKEDIIVGSPVAGRHFNGLENLIGVFNNTLALRTDLGNDPQFFEILNRVKETALNATKNQDIRFEQLLSELKVERDTSFSPVFQVLFNMLHFPDRTIEFEELHLEEMPTRTVNSIFDITVYVKQVTGKLELDLVYNPDLFDKPRMVEMLDQYLYLLEQIAADPDKKISHYSLSTPSFRKVTPDLSSAVTETWGDPVHLLFSKQAGKRPERLSVHTNHISLSYKELEERSNRLAHYFIAKGIKQQEIIAIHAHRSSELVIAILGVLKAGATFLILDSSYPAPRHIACLSQSSPAGWVQTKTIEPTQASLHHYLNDTPFKCVVTLDDKFQNEDLKDYDTTLPAVTIGKEDLAYIAFTSGSTGQPKGVKGQHGSLSYFLDWRKETFQLTAQDRFSMLSGLSHDPLHRDIFTALTLGAALYIPDPEELSPGDLSRWFHKNGIGVAHLIPAMCDMMTEDSQPLPSLKTVFFVGEELTKPCVSRLTKIAPQTKIVNLYGSTETQQALSYHIVSPDTQRDVYPLGRGIKDVQLLVLNGQNQLCGLGEIGEICIRSPFISPGYLNDPDQTRSQFLINPLTGVKQDRIYKTGDWGRYLPNGEVTFMGRADGQINLRGFRIELGDVETSLNTVPGIQKSVTMIHQTDHGLKRLIAYVITDTESISVDEIRRYLKANVPDYMIPQTFIPISSIPLTANGKTDYDALPKPEKQLFLEGTKPIQPRTATEELVSSIIEDVLGHEGFGIQSDFFELGGHSLLATQVVSRIRHIFGVEFSYHKFFEEPTIKRIADYINVLQQEKKHIIKPVIEKQPEANTIALSFAQSRLWFLDQYEQNKTIYNIPCACRLKGTLSPDLLEESLKALIDRHEILRTRFIEKDGTPYQVIEPQIDFKLNRFDLSLLSKPEREAAQKDHIKAHSETIFDLIACPLLKGSLLKLDENDHVFLLCVHHIIFDGWSFSVFLKELSNIYEAKRNGIDCELNGLDIQYKDFSLWQKKLFETEFIKKQLTYWQQQLGTDQPVLELPFSKQRPAKQTFKGDTVDFSISPETVETLKRLSRKNNCTVFMSLLALFKILLFRYTGQKTILIGTPIANRNTKEIENLIGFFVNTLVLKSDIKGDDSFKDLLANIRGTSLEAYENQDIPFETLVEELNPKRDLSYSPLFQVMFAYQNVPAEKLALKGVKTETMSGEYAVSKYDLSLFIWETDQALLGSLEYNTDLFDREYIENMSLHFQNLLRDIHKHAEHRISSLEFLSEREKHRTLVQRNRSAVTYENKKCLHQLLEDQVIKSPEKTAVVYENERVSYDDLNKKSNQLARYLVSKGVKSGSYVGVCIDRSIEMIIGVLGILKAGATYVPIDPDYPTERIRFIVEDTQCPLLLTQTTKKALFNDVTSKIICLDEKGLGIQQESTDNLPTTTTPQHLIYIIYTSGSTGYPKGVMLKQQSLINLVQFTQDKTTIDLSSTLQFASLGFDVSAQEIFSTLLSGGKLCLIDKNTQLNIEALWEQIRKHSIKTVFWPVSFTSMVFGNKDFYTTLPDSIRHIITAGEQLSVNNAFSHYLKQNNVHLHNHYGPSETHVVTTFTIKPEDDHPQLPAIGKPIANTTVYLLDGMKNPVPDGIPGELYLGGVCLGLGYLNRPDLTKESFIKNPFGDGLLYKTGDLARYLPNGDIVYIGRNDQQVKIRGFRIELGEIASALANFEPIKEAVVAAKDSAVGKILVAYIVYKDSHTPSDKSVKEALDSKLPSYMVPQIYIGLDKLPINSNGKVDRKALPDIEGHIKSSKPYKAPGNHIEKQVASIMEGVLKVKRMGSDADFFELGLHSLLATQVISRIRHTFGIEFPLVSLFEHPTVEGVAKSISQIKKGSKETQKPTLKRQTEKKETILSYAQQRLWFLDQYEPDTDTYSISIAKRLKGPLNISVLEESFRVLISRYEILRTRFVVKDGNPRQLIQSDWDFSIQVSDLRNVSKDRKELEAKELMRTSARTVFDLAACPLMKVGLIRLDEKETILLFTIHHIVFDGWSFSVFFGELSQVYNAKIKGHTPELNALDIQYKDYALWQKELFKDQLFENQLNYWRNQLKGELPVFELPFSKKRPPKQTFNGEILEYTLSEKLSKDLKLLGDQNGCTLFMTLLAAFKALLYKYSGNSDILIGTPIAGRNEQEVENQIGLFVNTLVIRSSICGDLLFKEFLLTIKRLSLEAYEFQDVPFEMLVEDLNPKRALSHSPLFQVMYSHQNVPENNLRFNDIETEAVKIDAAAAQFDLTLGTWEANGTIVCAFEFNTDLFDRVYMEQMLFHFNTLLESVVENSDQRIIDIPLLTEEEISRQIITWNDTAVDYPQHLSISEYVEGIVETFAGEIAVVFEDKELTYRELNESANRFANYLKDSEGVAIETPVGIFIEPSLEAIIAILAVLKAGGTYVPIDVTFPKDRLFYILNDAKIPLVLTKQKLKKHLAEFQGSIISLDTDNAESENCSHQNLTLESHAHNVAYIIYTSGSTGVPKGVMVPHRGVINLMTHQISRFKITRDENILLFSSISVDASLEQILLALFSGAKLTIASKEKLLDIERFKDFLRCQKITHLDSVPSYLSSLIGFRSKHLKRVITGGEACAYEIIKRLSSDYTVYNQYGPTETTIEVSSWEYREENDMGVVSIGKPLANTQIYILDSELNPLPIGVIGELHVGGDGVTKGYLGKPDLTDQRFIPDPFSKTSGARLYKTGDLGRFLPDGNIHYVGRNDEQTKIRGYRVELGEIVEKLLENDSINSAIIEKTEDERIIAYVCLKDNVIHTKDANYYMYTTSQGAEFKDQAEELHAGSWPDFFMGDKVSIKYWQKMYTSFPEFQFIVRNRNQTGVAVGNTIPLYWDGDPKQLPEGWDDAIIRGFQDRDSNRKANTLCVLAGVINNEFQGKGLSYSLINTFKSLAVAYGFEHIIFPVRPTLKETYPHLSVNEYTNQIRENGISKDPWLRVHERLGGKIIGYCERSQLIEGSISDWEAWTGQNFPESGNYVVKGAMQPVKIDIERNYGFYFDLAVWYQHDLNNVPPQGINTLTINSLKDDLSKFLPEYMIPTYFIPLDVIPLTPNGKIDKQALPSITHRHHDKSADFRAPVTVIEQSVAAVFQDVLLVEKVGLDDNFFNLGGHSLSAMLVVSRIRQNLNVELPLITLFEYPTLKGISDQIEIYKREAQKVRKPPLEKQTDQNEVVLSYAQRRLWFLDQYEQGGYTYNIPFAKRLVGELNGDALEASFQELIERHEILRTRFIVKEEDPIQVIETRPDFKINTIDLSHLSIEERQIAIKTHSKSVAEHIFDLTACPLLKATLLKLDWDEHILLCNAHHIVFDGWSFGIFFSELSCLYNSRITGEASGLKELVIHYKDYTLWQKKLFDQHIMADQMEYWRKKLSGEIPVLDLPFSNQRPTKKTVAGNTVDFTLSASLTNQLKSLGNENGCTLFMILLTGFKSLLFRYTNQNDLLIGTPVAGRNVEEIEKLVGFFVNTLVLRSTIHGHQTFRELLETIRKTSLEAYEHQDVPFEALVEDLNPKRALNYTPLFQVMFSHQNQMKEELNLDRLSVHSMPSDFVVSKFDLTLWTWEEADVIQCAFEYNTDLFDPYYIEKMVEHYQRLLTSAIQNMDQKISQLQILSDKEIDQLLIDWNDTSSDYPKDKLIHELFEEQAKQTPEAVALVFENKEMTFRELDKKSNQLGRFLQNKGVGPELLVGLCVERSLEMIIGLLGISKAGAAYMPIDPNYPEERISYLITDSDCHLLLTQESLKNTFQNNHSEMICLDTNWPDIEAVSDDPVQSGATPDNLFYIMYTSGSTGKPKSVEISHKNVNRLINHRDFSFLKQNNTVLQYAPISFDASTFEIWGSVCNGSKLVISPEGKLAIEELGTLITRNNISVLWLTSALFNVVVENCLEDLKNVKFMLAGGDILSVNHVKKLLNTYEHLTFINGYGPTENTTFTTLHFLNKAFCYDRSIPIGRPLDNTRVYIVNEDLEPVPIGCYGELLVEGDGVSRGYLGRPELNSEKFIQNPFSNNPESKLYKTGDLVRYLPSGVIEFKGRIDNQTKIRGYRIEPGEIEAALAKHEHVKQVVVEAKETPSGKALVAYIVQKGDQKSKRQSFITFLKAKLPDYLVPQFFIDIEDLPITPNGKVDRKALPDIDSQLARSTEYKAPVTQTEKRIASIMEDELKVNKVGLDDNFFELGGHSLTAIKVVRKLGRSLSVMKLFEHPTVRELASYLSGDQSNQKSLLYELTPPVPEDQKELSIVCIPYGGGEAIVYQPMSKVVSKNHSLYSIQLPGHDYSHPNDPCLSFQETVDLCVTEIKNKVTGSLIIYGHCINSGLAVAVGRRLGESQADILGICVAAAFPVPRLPGKILGFFDSIFFSARSANSQGIHDYLASIGGLLDTADKKEQEFSIKVMWHDVMETEDYYTSVIEDKTFKPSKIPIHCVFGGSDRLTEFYQERAKEWETYSQAVDYSVVPNGGHYFIKHQAEQTVEIIEKQAEVWQKAKHSNKKIEKKDSRNKKTVSSISPKLKDKRSVPVKKSPAKQNVAIPNLVAFALFAFGQFISIIGTNLTLFGCGIWVFQKTGSVTDFAFIEIFALLPGLLLSPIGGAVADRYDRRLVILFSDIMGMIGTALILVIFLNDSIQLWHILVANSIGSIAGAFQIPATTAAVTQLIPKQYLGRANGLIQFLNSSGNILAMLMGGFFMALIGLSGIIFIDMVTFIIGSLILLSIRLPNTMFKKTEETMRKAILGGWRFIAKRYGLLVVAAFYTVFNFFASIVFVLLSPMVLTTYSESTLGSVLAVFGVGSLLGGLAMILWGGTRKRTKGLVGFSVSYGCSFLLLALSQSPLAIMVCIAIAGFSLSLLNAHFFSLIQVKVGLELQGRVISLYQMLVWGSIPLGFLIAGPLADHLFEPFMSGGSSFSQYIAVVIGIGSGRGMALMMFLAGVLLTLWSIACYFYKPLMQLEDILPDAIPDAFIDNDKDKIQEKLDHQLNRYKN